MKKSILSTIVLFCILPALSPGCADQPRELQLTPVTIAFQNWVGYGPFYLAQAKGFCKEEGIELVFVDEQLDSSRREAFKQGILDFEAGTLDLLVSKAAQDTPVIAVMEIDKSFGGDAIVVTEKIEKLEDLIGKQVVLAPDDVGETFLAVLFDQKGLSLDRLAVRPVLSEEVANTFLTGEAEACVTWEPQVSEALKKPGSRILTSTKEHPDVIVDTLNVREELAKNHPGLVKSLMRAWFKGLRYYNLHPDEASAIIAPYYKITPEQYRRQVKNLQWQSYEGQIKSLKSGAWIRNFNTIVNLKLKTGRISRKPEAQKFLNQMFLEKLHETGQ